MLHLFKLFWFVVKELLFDSKEEYDFRSKKFNSKKMTAAIILMLSFVMNIWLLQRFYSTSTNYMVLKKEHVECVAKQEESDAEIEHLTQLLEDAEDKPRRVKTKQKVLDKKQPVSVIQ